MGTELPAVIGDPAGMRELAVALRSTARQVEDIDSAVVGKVGCLAFTGPAATRLADVINSWHSSVSDAALSLADTAALLERAASEVQAEQAARARLQAQIDKEALSAR